MGHIGHAITHGIGSILHGAEHFILGSSPKIDAHYAKLTPLYDPAQRALIDAIANLQKEQLGKGQTPYQGETVASLNAYKPALQQAQQYPVLGDTYNIGKDALGFVHNIFTKQTGLGHPYNEGVTLLSQLMNNNGGNISNDYSQASQIFNNLGDNAPTLGDTYQSGTQALDSLLNPNSQQSQDYWNKAFVNPALMNWQQNIMPRVREAFISRNAGESGAANTAIARSGRDLSTQLSGQLANILNEAENRKLQALPEALQYSELPADLQMQYNQQKLGALSNIAGQSISNRNSALNRALQSSQVGLQYAQAPISNTLDIANAALTAAPEALSYAKTPTTLQQQYLNNLMASGQIQRSYQQQLLDEAYKKWLMSQPYSNPYTATFWSSPYSAIRQTQSLNKPTVTSYGGSGGLLGSILPSVGKPVGNVIGGHLGSWIGGILK